MAAANSLPSESIVQPSVRVESRQEVAASGLLVRAYRSPLDPSILQVVVCRRSTLHETRVVLFFSEPEGSVLYGDFPIDDKDEPGFDRIDVTVSKKWLQHAEIRLGDFDHTGDLVGSLTIELGFLAEEQPSPGKASTSKCAS